MPDLTHELRDKISAAIAAGDYEGALRSLGEPAAPRRKSLFALADLIEEDDGPTVWDGDPAELAAMIDVRRAWMAGEMKAALTAHVVSTLNKLRGRAD